MATFHVYALQLLQGELTDKMSDLPGDLTDVVCSVAVLNQPPANRPNGFEVLSALWSNSLVLGVSLSTDLFAIVYITPGLSPFI